ncbi:MAG: RES family NAD+ phosphorylase [Hyphomicrobiales bacterium]
MAPSLRNYGDYMHENGKKHICDNCVADNYLDEYIRNNGNHQLCNYCDNERCCVQLHIIAGFVENCFEIHFERTASEPDGYERAMQSDKEFGYDWWREGDTTENAIRDALGCEENLARDLQIFLQEEHSDIEIIMCGEECEFGYDVHYEQIMPNSNRWHQKWHEFEKTLKTETRFFNKAVTEFLNSLFSDIEKLTSFKGETVILTAGPKEKLKNFFRARTFNTNSDLEAALERPDLELAPPPTNLAKAGRMNARGISVFYGSTTEIGALSEVRPPVSSKTLIGRFDLLRPMKLLNLSVLTSIIAKGSLFDPLFIEKSLKVKLLRTLTNRISRPIMPSDEETEYLPTQVVLDFLANGLSLKLDGVLFPSAQTNNETTNVVLFHKSSRVEEFQIDDSTSIEVRTFEMYEDGPEQEYSVIERIPKDKNAKSKFDFGSDLLNLNIHAKTKKSNLKLDANSLKILIVKSTNYKVDSYDVRRQRIDLNVVSEKPFPY